MERMTMTIGEMAEALGISKTKAYELAHTDGFPLLRCGRKMLVSRQGFAVWLAEHTGGEAIKCIS